MLKRVFWQQEYQILTAEFDGEIALNDCQQVVQEPAYLLYVKNNHQPVTIIFHLLESAYISDEINHIHVLHHCMQNNFSVNNLARFVVVGRLDTRASFRTIIATAMELLGVNYSIMNSYNQALEVLTH